MTICHSYNSQTVENQGANISSSRGSKVFICCNGSVIKTKAAIHSSICPYLNSGVLISPKNRAFCFLTMFNEEY